MKIFLHADMNSYFASVEQQANPFLRGKPVAISSRISRNACIIACSVEAKKLGIKTGFSLSEAREVAPSIVALEVDPPKVRSTTKKIFAVFADYTSAIEAYSIDEAFLDLTGHVENFEAARELALAIKERIKNEVGDWLKCSIGIAPTRWLAKFAGELQKPDGLTVLLTQDLPLVYAGMPVDKAWGIADGWKARLLRLGIETLDQLLKYDPLELKRRFGIPGYLLWTDIAGVDIARAKDQGAAPPKSIGHSYVFHRRTDDPKQISAIMMKLCERVGVRLRKQKFETKRISVGWGYEENGGGNSMRCPDPVFESYDIFRAALRAFCAGWNGRTVTFLAITASELAPTVAQISIFNDKSKRQNIAAALDAVNGRYGDYTVIRGQMWGTKEYAPDRVGFRQSVAAIRNDDIISSVEE
jgi:DNA polymerase-4